MGTRISFSSCIVATRETRNCFASSTRNRVQRSLSTTSFAFSAMSWSSLSKSISELNALPTSIRPASFWIFFSSSTMIRSYP